MSLAGLGGRLYCVCAYRVIYQQNVNKGLPSRIAFRGEKERR